MYTGTNKQTCHVIILSPSCKPPCRKDIRKKTVFGCETHMFCCRFLMWNQLWISIRKPSWAPQTWTCNSSGLTLQLLWGAPNSTSDLEAASFEPSLLRKQWRKSWGARTTTKRTTWVVCSITLSDMWGSAFPWARIKHDNIQTTWNNMNQRYIAKN